MTKVWIIDDEEIIRDSLSQLLQIEGYEVQVFAKGTQALKALDERFQGVVISDINMPEMCGTKLLDAIQAIDVDIPVIMLTGYADVQLAVSCLHQGAYDFFEKPITEQLLDSVKRASEKRTLVLENRTLKNSLKAVPQKGVRILGETPEMQDMMALLNTVVDTPADVLISGETGSGKEMVARYLHEMSSRADANFVAINCGAIPESLIESELFGSKKGAFTGATENRTGQLCFGQGGTIFLDEIESMPMSMQVKMLRVLEDRSVTPVGSTTVIPLDVRFVAATKIDLLELAEQGLFRTDLYYRLNLVKVDIPPLRARKADIPLLFKHFSSIAAGRYHKPLTALASEESNQLMAYHWPGNVRELRNAAERRVLLGMPISIDADQPSVAMPEDLSLSEKVAFFECAVIEEALSQSSGSVKEAISLLRVPRKTFYDKLAKYGIQRRSFVKD